MGVVRTEFEWARSQKVQDLEYVYQKLWEFSELF